jgi:hypothetical protein
MGRLPEWLRPSNDGRALLAGHFLTFRLQDGDMRRLTEMRANRPLQHLQRRGVRAVRRQERLIGYAGTNGRKTHERARPVGGLPDMDGHMAKSYLGV